MEEEEERQSNGMMTSDFFCTSSCTCTSLVTIEYILFSI